MEDNIKRLVKCLDGLSLDSRRVGQLVGMSHGPVSMILTGERSLPDGFIEKLLDVLPISEEYIQEGKGKQYTGSFDMVGTFGSRPKERTKKNVEVDVIKRLKHVREGVLDVTQEEFADTADLTRRALSGIENHRQNPSLALLKGIHLKYGVNLNYIIANTGQEILQEKDRETLDDLRAEIQRQKLIIDALIAKQ